MKTLIISMRRSGGTLLNNLLDGHPECSVYPFEHWHTRFKATFNPMHNFLFPFLPPRRKLELCGFHDTFRSKFEHEHGAKKWKEFKEALLKQAHFCHSTGKIYDVASELYFTQFHPSGLNRIIVNHCANLSLLSRWELRRTFGDCRFLLSVRNPCATFCSMKFRRLKAKRKDFPRGEIMRFCNNWRRGLKTYYLNDSGTVKIKFESLVKHPEEVMHEVSRQLGIEFLDILCIPTKIGEPVDANSSFQRNSGIDPKAADSWKEYLPKEERSLIENELSDLMKILGYS